MSGTKNGERNGNSCPTCHRRLPTRQGMRQHHAKVHDENLPNRTCNDCGTEFYDSKSQREFCGDCNPNGGKNNGNWKGAKETTTCHICDTEFEYYPSDKKGIYCSDCVESADGLLPENPSKPIERVITECGQCGAEIRVLPARVERNKRGFFCNQKCHGQWLSENVVGENHHQWQGGNIPYGETWWRIRREARERDGHRCRNCGVSAAELGREPDVHNLKPVHEFDRFADAHTLENVISLCRPCHRLVEDGNIDITEVDPRR